MRKLSQKELIHEGFGSFVRGLGRVAGQAARGTAKTLLPKTTSILGKGAELAAGAIENIKSGSPAASVKRFLGGEEGKRTFKNIKLGKEERLPNGDYKVPITSGVFMNDLGGGKFEDKDVSGGFMIVRQKERPGGAGFDNKILEVHDKNGKLNKRPINAGSKNTSSTKPMAGGKPAARPQSSGKSGQPGKGGEAGRGDREDDGMIKRGAEAIGKSALKGAEAIGKSALKGVEAVGGAALGGVKNVGKSALKGAETVAGDVYEKGKEIAGSNQLPDPDELNSPAQEEPAQEPRENPNRLDSTGNEITRGSYVTWPGKQEGKVNAGEVLGWDGNTGRIRIKHSRGNEITMTSKNLTITDKPADARMSITSDTINTAIAAAGKSGFETNKLDQKAVRDVKALLEPKRAEIEKNSEYRPTIKGVRIPNPKARAILATESKKSQKSLLKHLHSLSH